MVACYTLKSPSNDRLWEVGQQKTSSISIDENNRVSIENMRDFDWVLSEGIVLNLNSNSNKKNNYKNFQFDLSNLESMQVAVSHFSAINEIAHVFLMFELNNKQKFGFSIEARREKGEKYSLLGGLFGQFELIYLFATEDDLIGLRKSRDEKLFLYPTKINSQEIQKIFQLIINKTNRIASNPKLYHLFFKNCTTGIVDIVEQVSGHKYPKLIQALMPGNAGKALYEMELIASEGKKFEAVQQAALVK